MGARPNPGPLRTDPVQHSESFAAVAAALAKAQGDFPTIPRDRKVTVAIKDRQTGAKKGEYSFWYAPLETILAAVRKPLAANSLALVQAIMAEDAGDGRIVEVMRTTLVHESGEWLACDVPMFVGTGDNRSQAYSSGMTYARRYGVTTLLVLAADEDDDGNGGDQDEDRLRPDYEPQGSREPYRGSFPRQGGGRSQKPAPEAPRAPQRKAEAPAPGEDSQAEGGVPLHEGLSAGQVSLLTGAMAAAGLSAAEALALVGGETITPASFHAAHLAVKAKLVEG